MKNGTFKQMYQKAKLVIKGTYFRLRKGKTPIKELKFVYHLADHCNLNCKCCDHFSPIAEKKLADIDSFKNDIRCLANLCGGVCNYISLQGGEPLLHPNAIDFAVAARKAFKKGRIKFTTNGLLLAKQPDLFWQTCAKYDIEFEVTKYPIPFDYGEIQKRAEEFGVHFYIYNDNETVKTTYLMPLDVSGKQPFLKNYCKCMHANTCILLKNGRLYTCTVAPNIEHFNNYFHQNLSLSEADSINIYKAKSFEEIADFLAKPIPFCRYCNVNGREYGLKWGQSSKDISEWVKDK